MLQLKYKKFIIILFFIISIVFYTGCSFTQSNKNIDIDDVQEKTISYLTEQNYEVEFNNSLNDRFIIECRKQNQLLSVDFVKIRDNQSKCTVLINNSIDEYAEKYSSIDYENLFNLIDILGIKNIKSNIIKNACEDKRDYYDSSNNDLSHDNKIMKKIYRVGFWENPIIKYELSLDNNKYTEVVTISWN